MTLDDDTSYHDEPPPPPPPPSPPLESTKSPFVSNLRKRLSSEKRLDDQDGQEVVVRLKSGRRKSLSKADSASMRLALSQKEHKPVQEQTQLSQDQEREQQRVHDELTPLRDTYKDQLLGAFTTLLAESEAAMKATPELMSGAAAGSSKQQDAVSSSFMQTLSREEALQLVPVEVFVGWAEIEDVVAEGTLSLDAIQQHFEALAVMDARGRSGVDFESFCVLMEQLEAAWQDLAGSSESSPPEPSVSQEEPLLGRSRAEEEEEGNSCVSREQYLTSPVSGDVSTADEISRRQQIQQEDQAPPQTAPPLPLPHPRNRLAASDVADTASDTLPQDGAFSELGLLSSRSQEYEQEYEQEKEQEQATDSGSSPFASRLSLPPPPAPSDTITSDNVNTATVTYIGSHQEQLHQLASNRQLFVCGSARLNVAQSAARAGQERELRQRRKAVRQREEEALQRRVDAARVQAEQAVVREKQLATKSQELFAHLRVIRCQAEEQRSHEKQVLSYQKMVELEDRRVEVLWKVLADCSKHFFSPQECRELSRLYLHLRRATSADSSKVTETVHRRAMERQAQLLSSVRDMRCVVVEEAVAANPLHGE